jgi:hypothetical protein
MRLDQRLDWNPDTEKITNNEIATSMLSKEMREPWDLEKS